MKIGWLPALALVLLLGGCEDQAAAPTAVPTTPGTATVGGMPLNIALAPGNADAVVSTGGFQQGLYTIDTKTGQVVSQVDFSPSHDDPLNGLYYGLCFAPDGTLYAAQGVTHRIAVLKAGDPGHYTLHATIETADDEWPCGLAMDNRGLLYVTNLATQRLFGHSGLSLYDPASGRRLGTLELPGEAHYSATVAALQDGSKAYVGNLRDANVTVVDTRDPAHLHVLRSIDTGAHPDAMLLDHAQQHLFVANGVSDTVSVVSTVSDTVEATLPLGAGALTGTTPTGLALSPDERTLYVSLAGMNAVALVDVATHRILGYRPTGLWPTALVSTGEHLLVCNGYGSEARHPNPDYDAWHGGVSISNPGYVLNKLTGTVSMVDATPDEVDTRRVLAADHLASALRPTGLTGPRPHHVFYIIKENRTYDQVLGDLPQGNGDAALALFDRDVTPNQHALAERFTLFDNFYTNGDVSGSGWVWSTQGLANESVLRSMAYVYRLPGKLSELNYNFEGQVLGYLTGGFPAGLSRLFPSGLPPIPNVSENPNGYLWDEASRHHVSYRNYGFYYSFGVQDAVPDNYPAVAGLQPPGHDLEGVSDADYRRFDLDFADSDGPEQVGAAFALPTYGQSHGGSRYAEWAREFRLMVAHHAVPKLVLLRLGNDHTSALKGGRPSPRAYVADNDYAVGEVVDTISHSPIWKDTAIVIVEDDAQNGPDHVDCHRSPCYLISPWIAPHTVDHGFYNTDSVLRTIEALLGLSPLTLDDALAQPLGGWTRRPENSAPYTALLPPAAVLRERNPQAAALAPTDPMKALVEQSDELPFDRPDQAPAEAVNRLVWKSVRGAQATMPEPVGAEPAATRPDDDDD